MFPHLGKGASDYAMANGAVALYAQQWQKRLNETEVFAICWPDWLDAGVLTRLPASTVDRVRAIFEGMGMPLVSAAVGLSLFGSVFQKPDCGLRLTALVDQAKFRFALENLPKGNSVGRAAVALSDEPANRIDEIQVHVDRWEAQRRSGGEITPAMVSAVIGPTDLAGLPAPLVGRIHRLLFASSSRSDPNDSATQWHAAIREAIMAVLKLKTLSDSKPLQDYGLDSISAMLLATRLEKALQIKVQPQWLIEHPTVDSLVDYLMRQSSGSPVVGA
jgi:acyl carrier protein